MLELAYRSVSKTDEVYPHVGSTPTPGTTNLLKTLFKKTMARQQYQKLIRDKIPQIIKDDNAQPKVRELNSKEFISALKDKVLEEAQELKDTKNKKELLNELADLLQLITTLAKNHNFSLDKVEKKMLQKAKERGAFQKKLFLEYTDE